MLRRLRPLVALVWMLAPCAFAQYVTLTGTLSAANGLEASNYTLTLKPSQAFFVAGTSVFVNSAVSCATDANGAVVGIHNPTQFLISAVAGGTMPAGTYYVAYAWTDAAGHVTAASAVEPLSLPSGGGLSLSPPALGAPAAAAGINVYMSTAPSSLTLQGQVAASGTYTQSSAISTTGAAAPTTNTTICSVVANDAGWPTGTGYEATLIDPSGNVLPGYPWEWRLLGPNTTINLSQGFPTYDDVVTYPTPILATPFNHNTQSIAGGLIIDGPATVQGAFTAQGSVAAGQLFTNSWAINEQGQTFYFEGSSITIGYTLGTSLLSGGGYAGNYGNLLANSVWGTGNGTYYNDGVSGSTTTQTLARYTTGNTALGVAVPSAHSVSPRQRCATFLTAPSSCSREFFFLDLTSVVNSANAGILTAQAIADTQNLIAAARNDGYFVVLLTSPATQIPGNTAGWQEMWDVDAAARNGTIPSDLFVDLVNVIPNEYDGTLYTGASITNMAIHPNAAGHLAIASAVLAAMIGHGSAAYAYSGDYHQEPTTLTGIVNAIAGNVTTVRNTNSSGFSSLAFLDSTGFNQGQIGYGNSAAPVLSSTFYVNTATSGSPLALAVGGVPMQTLTGAGTTLNRPIVSNTAGGGTATIQSLNAAGYSNVALVDYNGVATGQLSYSNPTAAILPGLFGLNSATTSAPVVMATGGVERARFTQKGLQLSLSSVPIAQASTAPTGSCTALAWVISDDGHITYCNGSTYQLKL